MIDHVTLNVQDLETSRLFYERLLAPLGYRVAMSYPAGVGFGQGPKPDFWLAQRPPRHTAVHVAFAASDCGAVDAFHAAGLEAGGRDNGPPGPRAHYHPTYYGAFVLDPDGNNVEAVCHR